MYITYGFLIISSHILYFYYFIKQFLHDPNLYFLLVYSMFAPAFCQSPPKNQGKKAFVEKTQNSLISVIHRKYSFPLM